MPALDDAHALVIGIDAGYRHVPKLPPTRDAAAIADLLAGAERGGYAPDRVRLLANEAATADAVRSSLNTLANETGTDSIVFLYFSGHGYRVGSNQYLLPVDADLSSDEALAATTVSGEALTAVLSRLPARKVVVVFDACHAGGMGAIKGVDAAAARPGLAETFYERLAAGRGRAILASSRETEESLVFAGDQHGLFTKHLLAGIAGGVKTDDGLVRIFDLFEYVQPRVTAEAGTALPQHPVFKADLEENFPVALRLGGHPAPVGRAADGYRYDAYISYVDTEPDATWVWETLVPRLEDAELRVAVSGDSADPGVARLVSQERGIEQARRTVAVLSDAYLDDHAAEFENLIAQTMGVGQGQWRLVPVSFGSFDRSRLPVRLGMLTSLELGDSRRGERAMERLVNALADQGKR